MRIRSSPLVATVCVVAGLGTLLTFPGVFLSEIRPAARAIEGVVALGLIAAFIRMLFVGLDLQPDRMTVRELFTTDRVPRAQVLGLAVEPLLRGRFRRLVLVCSDGRVLPARWALAGRGNLEWDHRVTDLALGFGPTQPQVAGALAAVGRLALDAAVPIATRDPGLTPATVSPVTVPPTTGAGQSLWLGRETIFVVAAMVLPGLAAAIGLLVQHFVTHQDLNEFDLPFKHHPGASLVVLDIEYLTTAVVVPIALLLLARTGQPPSSLGLSLREFRRDALGGVGLLAGVWLANLVIVVPLTALFNTGTLTNGEHNSHVPAYFVIYGLLVSLTTAINEEVIVNGYFLTRLSQLGYSPRAAFAISLAVRSSYHVYYGLGFLATIPFGYLVTRSFQKRGKLTRPIIAHFLYDATLFTIAVLTS